MTRYQYLKALDKALSKKLSSKEVEDTINYYDGYFEEAIDYGKNEHELMVELGSPEKLAESILEELGTDNKFNESKNVFTTVSDWIQRQTRKKEYVSFEPLVIENYQGIHKIHVSLVSGHIELGMSRDNMIHVSYQNLSDELFDFHYDEVTKELVFKERNNELLKKYLNVKILLPKAQDLDINLSSLNGSITIQTNEDIQMTQLNVHVVHGALKINGVHASTLITDQISGHTYMDGLVCHRLTCKTVHGSMTVLFKQDDRHYSVVASTVVGKVDLFGRGTTHYQGNNQGESNRDETQNTKVQLSTVTGAIKVGYSL